MDKRTIITTQIFMTLIMSLCMSAIMLLIAVGPNAKWLELWPVQFLAAWPIAFVMTQIAWPIASLMARLFMRITNQKSA